jgi:hypothetical protein
MINKANQTIAILIGTNIVSYLCNASLMRQLVKEKRQYKNLHAFSHYLMAKMEENEVELTEFDLIALRTFIEGD